jgi:two-component system, response regulator PdtaR
VEDEALIRFAIAEALHQLGVSVVEAATADEAWQYPTAGGSVDLVFTVGGQLATQIRLQYPSVVVIVTSGYFDDRGWSEPIVPKPYNPFETATALAERARRGL